MKEEYRVKNIFNDSGVAFNELISNFVLSFLDKEFNTIIKDGIINTM